MENPRQQDVKYELPSGCFLRLFWMIVGNFILLFCAIAIAQNPSGWLGVADAFFWAIVGCLLAARYVDIRRFRGRKADGSPASMADWRRYALLIGGASVVLWLAVHGVAYLGAAGESA
ncbi:MAG: hypothetical protein JXB62_15825 [Pirellulales bacterium]|nr:hypothetical protein [Pirellulales bacterium]